MFFCDYGNPLDANGLAYVTQQPPATQPGPGDAVDYVEHVSGNWYSVLEN